MRTLSEAGVRVISQYVLAKQLIVCRKPWTRDNFERPDSKRSATTKSVTHQRCLAVNSRYLCYQHKRFSDNLYRVITSTTPPSGTMVQVLCICSRCSTKIVKVNNIEQPGQLVHPTTRLDHEKRDKQSTSSKPKHQSHHHVQSESVKKEIPTKGI